MDNDILENALKKMGFGENLTECLLSLEMAIKFNALRVVSSLESFGLTNDEQKAVAAYIKSFLNI